MGGAGKDGAPSCFISRTHAANLERSRLPSALLSPYAGAFWLDAFRSHAVSPRESGGTTDAAIPAAREEIEDGANEMT